MQDLQNIQSLNIYTEEMKRNARCAKAIDSLKLFMKDAKGQLKTSIPLSTLELIVETVDGPQSTNGRAVYYDNAPGEVAYVP